MYTAYVNDLVCVDNLSLNYVFFPISSKCHSLSPTRFHRKSWLVPTQYLLGLFMLYLSVTVNSLLQSEEGPNVAMLTAVFFMLAFLAATQVGFHKHCDMNTLSEREMHSAREMVSLQSPHGSSLSASKKDIAVDGWALTMLSRQNVGYASTCNSVGQTAGYFLGNVLFLALESADFCNKYLRMEPKDTGIVTLSGISGPPPPQPFLN